MVVSGPRVTSPAQALDVLTDRFGSPMRALSLAQRGFLIAAPGKRFVASDLSGIEGRVNAWVSGEVWKVQAYRDYDTITGHDASGKPIRKGHDLYNLAYARAYNIPVDRVTKPDRQIGKVMELALGYQGGKHAFASMAVNYGITVVEQLEDAPRGAERVLTYDQADDIKVKWRKAHPAIVAFWRLLQEAAIQATEQPLTTVWARQIAYRHDGTHLFCRLPSGRCITYPYATVGDGEYGPQLRYYGIDSRPGRNKRWGQLAAYGGMLCENVVQGIAADVLMCAWERIEAAGYPIVIHVHDENVCEVPEGFGSHQELSRLMTIGEDWCPDLPLASAGWEGKRYKKD